MLITNKTGLDPALYQAIVQSMEEYDNGGAYASVTNLKLPSRIFHLQKRHWDEIEQDAADLIWAFWGSIGHLALERQSKEGVAEQRLMIKIGGRKISGKADHISPDGTISDYKFVTVEALNRESVLEDWSFQLNSYAALFRLHGYKVQPMAKIQAFLKNWDYFKLQVKKDYPTLPVKTVPIVIYPELTFLDKLKARVWDFAQTEELPDDLLPECTPEDKWERCKAFAIIEPGKKRATRVLPSMEEAQAYIDEHKLTEAEIKERPGSRVRCERYCLVRDFCNQNKREGDVKAKKA